LVISVIASALQPRSPAPQFLSRRFL